MCAYMGDIEEVVRFQGLHRFVIASYFVNIATLVFIIVWPMKCIGGCQVRPKIKRNMFMICTSSIQN